MCLKSVFIVIIIIIITINIIMKIYSPLMDTGNYSAHRII